MKNAELVGKLQEIDQKFAQLGDFQNKINEITAANDAAAAIKLSIERAPEEVEAIKTAAIESQVLINTIKEEAISLKDGLVENNDQLAKLLKRSGELQAETENQLGIVSSEKLSLAFRNEADKLEKTTDLWFKRYCQSTLILFIATVAIIIWELLSGGQFLSAGFAIKFTITAPLLYFVIFIHRQYNRTKHLNDEYTFKSSVARSFEAYRQIFKEDGTSAEGSVGPNVIEFFIKTVSDLYKSPCLPDDEGVTEKEAEGILKRFLSIFKDFKL